MSAPGRGGVIRTEEHALDWLYARSLGIHDARVARDWADKDRQGRSTVRAPGWWWNQLGKHSENQDLLIYTLALRDARSASRTPMGATAMERDLLALLVEHERGLWGGEQGSTTYGWMHCLGYLEIAAVTAASEPLGASSRRLLGQSVALAAAHRDGLGDCWTVGSRSKRDHHPAVARFVAACRRERVKPVTAAYRPGNNTINRSLYLGELTDRALAGPLADWVPVETIEDVRLRCPQMLLRWADGTRAAYIPELTGSYDGPSVAAVWGGGRRSVRAVPSRDGEKIHAFYPHGRPQTARHERGRIVATYAGDEHTGGREYVPASCEVVLPVPDTDPVEIIRIG